MSPKGPGVQSGAAEPALGVSNLQGSGLRACVEGYTLTNREKDIVLMVLQGMSNKEIARSICVAEQTVKDHLKHVYGKMGVHQRTALCAKVLGILPQ